MMINYGKHDVKGRKFEIERPYFSANLEQATDPGLLMWQRVLVLANVPDIPIEGLRSQGLVLSAMKPYKKFNATDFTPLRLDEDYFDSSPPGTRLYLDGAEEPFEGVPPFLPKHTSSTIWKKMIGLLRMNENSNLVFNNKFLVKADYDGKVVRIDNYGTEVEYWKNTTIAAEDTYDQIRNKACVQGEYTEHKEYWDKKDKEYWEWRYKEVERAAAYYRKHGKRNDTL